MEKEINKRVRDCLSNDKQTIQLEPYIQYTKERKDDIVQFLSENKKIVP